MAKWLKLYAIYIHFLPNLRFGHILRHCARYKSMYYYIIIIT